MNEDVLRFESDSGDLRLRLTGDENVDREIPAVEKQFVNFMFLRVIPAWRKLRGAWTR